MRRRDFLGLTAGAFAARTLAGSFPAAWASEPVDAPTDAAAFRAARRYATLPCGRVAYVERGKGKAALFLHGFPLSGFQWRGALDRLSRCRRCIVPDFLGLGTTEVADGQSVTPAAQVTMLLGLLDQLSVRTADVIANDSGGAVAQLLLARHPERVRTLLLTNCDVENDSPPPVLLPIIESARAGTFIDKWIAPYAADKDLARKEGLGGHVFTYLTNPTDEANDLYLAPLVSSPARKALATAYVLGLAPNPLAGIETALRRSQAPVRVVWGTADTIFSSASPDYLDRTLPHSRGVRRIAGGRLFFPEEFPDIIAEEARRLWGVG